MTTCVIECSRHRFGGYIKPFGCHSIKVSSAEKRTRNSKQETEVILASAYSYFTPTNLLSQWCF